MLDAICREIRNYFTLDSDKIIGNFKIVGGVILPSFAIQEGQYFKIWDSVFNSDVYIKGQEQLQDEDTFHGAIWLMRPPKDFLALVDDIAAWQAKYGTVDSVAMSPYNSESFGGYSYSKSTGGGGSGSSAGGSNWQSVFAARLSLYRRYKI